MTTFNDIPIELRQMINGMTEPEQQIVNKYINHEWKDFTPKPVTVDGSYVKVTTDCSLWPVWWALDNGHDELVKWLVSRGHDRNETICGRAASKGSLELVKWARSQGYRWFGTCSSAAVKGHLEIIQWASENGYPFTRHACTVIRGFAEIGGHTHIYEWLDEHLPRLEEDYQKQIG